MVDVGRGVVRAAVGLRREPGAIVGLETEALFGEVATVYDTADGWSWVQLERDGYVGYLPADSLSASVSEPTHHVSAVGTFVYAAADIKSPPLMHLSIGSLLTISDGNERMSQLASGGWVVNRHITMKGKYSRDFVNVAERLIETPYLWGGRTRVGIDCSGLLQVSMQASGLECPRDSDMQLAELGANVLIPEELEGLERGDLVFWRGHVAMMVDAVMMVHANAHHMAVVVEPLSVAAKRIARTGSEIVAIKRPERLGA